MKRYKSTLYTVFALFALGFISYLSMNAFNVSESTAPVIEPQPKVSLIRIFAKNQADIGRMNDAGLFLDHAESKIGYYIDTWLSEYEIESLIKSGISYQVLVDDWQIYYDSRPKMTQGEVDAQMRQVYEEDNITHSIFGSMNGYLKYDEMVAKLDSLRQEYPQFISAKFSIGTTYENRTIWAVRITNGPDAPTGRQEVLYHALIHAREPESMEAQLYYFYWLFENYNTEHVARYILNNREIYWVPVYNVDGYVYNQTTNPNGGGQWRTNRHNTGSNCGYTDPNRNYGIYEFWNSSNNGSSTDQCSGGLGTYRGSSPFSELETQAMRNFVNSRNFKTCLGAHTYGNLLIKPWAWSDPQVTTDDAIFQQYSLDMTDTSNYAIGTATQTVAYAVRGGADDWYYNDSGHTKIIALTPETGSVTEGFWPPQNRIIPLAQGMLFTNQYIAMAAGAFTNPLSKTFSKLNYTQNESGTYKIVLKNKGLLSAANVKIEWTPISPLVSIPTQSFTRANINSFVNDSVTFSFTVSGSAPNGSLLATTLKIKQNDTNTVYTEVVYVPVNGTVLLLDSAENGTSNWTLGQGWNTVTTQFHSSTHSFTDSPTGNYANNANNPLTLASSLNVSSYQKLFLSFWHRFDTEARYDFCIVEVSTNNGTLWTALNTYSYNGHARGNWRERFYDITSAANNSNAFKVRFRLLADGGDVYDGWYIDDVRIIGYSIGITGITSSNNNIPGKFLLEQNYPNPFNPFTLIKYQVPVSTNVKITVFDILGKKVATLVDQKKEAGFHEVEFSGKNLASGLYIYRIEAGDFSDVKKMMLVK
ncbi:MAG: T9SS type A sorting domain-containing protein [Ignavibacteria bacterium]|nr:T9SS type A sorting domain-containing protein [Ignavibacteria bacterium]MCC7158357.1 T9SS type A sorting domain-containing protein [Ignavibacteria bacterium]